jgi:hypothetical protein
VDPVLCLLPSPLLGPAVWRPVARQLAVDGWAVAEVPWMPVAPRTGPDVLETLVEAVPGGRGAVLIPHSNAGLYVPAVTARRRVAGYVFVDAGLPGHAGSVPMIPPGLHEFLAGKADGNGALPPWTQWWDEDISGLFPNAEVREEVEGEQHSVPLSYFREKLPVPSGWDDQPGAYLAFGDTYAAERAEAAARGWPVRTLPGEHLHMLIDPGQVAGSIGELVTELAGYGQW